jgi:hypothetical protein
MEGDYLIYRNENTELPENMCIKRMLGIDWIDLSRRFHYGNLFVIKFTEQSIASDYTVHDIPEDSFLVVIAPLQEIFSQEWNDAFLELELRRDQYFEAHQLKLETDKEVLYQRMYAMLTIKQERDC